jgi:hypothetical protein
MKIILYPIRTLTNFIILISIITTINAQEPKLGDYSDGSRSIPIHLIKIFDHDSSIIRLDEQPLLPYSPKMTCGQCHDYNKIKNGWHFNAGDSTVEAGRPGQPWIYVNQNTMTQIPLSYRQWQGTFNPQQIGMHTLEFIQYFGGYMPGGGIGEDESIRRLENLFRWQVTGNLEINCMTCHDAESAHDRADYVSQIARQNYRWAATAGSGFGLVRGSAIDMPDTYDIYFGAAPDLPQKVAPQVFYDKSRFNFRNEVFFNVKKNIPNENCFFCHSTNILDSRKPERWQYQTDVHLKAGLNCVDCHRNGLNHDMLRGYENETHTTMDQFAQNFTCKGCHLGNESNKEPVSGIFGAPKPKHAGIPAIHFEKLTCTTCHSGPWPQQSALSIKTSLNHRLGSHGVNKSPYVMPHLLSPVYIKQDDEKIAPFNLFWPAYWGEVNGDSILPIPIKMVNPVVMTHIVQSDTARHGGWLDITAETVSAILDSLITGESILNPVYITGGKVYQKSGESLVIFEKHAAAKPYYWSLGHDVRPAVQSLGSGGCDDCHATNSNFYYSKIYIDSPLDPFAKQTQNMISFQDANTIGTWIFSLSFLFRPWLKLLIIIPCIFIFSIMFYYLVKGLVKISKIAANDL